MNTCDGEETHVKRVCVCVLTDVTEVLESVLSGSMINLFPVHQQRETVKQTVDGEPRLMDGQDDGATAVRHPKHIIIKHTRVSV